MATAVFLWSPVIITVRMPDVRHLAMASRDLRAGRVDHGHQADEGQVALDGFGRVGVRAPVEVPEGDGQDAEGLARSSRRWPSGSGRGPRRVSGRSAPPSRMQVQSLSRRSGAPLAKAVRSCSARRTMLIFLRSESNGISSTSSKASSSLAFPDAGLGRRAEEGDLGRVADDARSGRPARRAGRRCRGRPTVSALTRSG